MTDVKHVVNEASHERHQVSTAKSTVDRSIFGSFKCI